MKSVPKFTLMVLLSVLAGCATLPTGPSVRVLPAQGKPFETFMTEDTTCRHWAEQQLGAPVQETYNRNVATGAVAGTAIGAGLGAAVGSASGHAGTGAAIGAASGLLFGTAAGANAAQVNSAGAQRRYDNAYVQCMYAYGNQIPGTRRVAQAAPPVAVDPPPAVAPPPPPLDTSPAPQYYPPPPNVYLKEAPQFIYTPALNMYVAVGVPYDLIYTGSEYFYFYGGRWYHGPYYNGPWVFAPRRIYPVAFIKFRIGDIHHFRDVEFSRYQHDKAHYFGRFHHPEFRGERRG